MTKFEGILATELLEIQAAKQLGECVYIAMRKAGIPWQYCIVLYLFVLY